jgi:DNA-binding CsgD family transcriptional regulator
MGDSDGGGIGRGKGSAHGRERGGPGGDLSAISRAEGFRTDYGFDDPDWRLFARVAERRTFVMAIWNVPYPSHKSGADFPTSANPGLSLLPMNAWPRLGMALRLSPREMQIVQGVFEDRKEESIAYGLGISPHTVNTYFQRLYIKLRVCSRPQLIVRVMAEYLTMMPGMPDTQGTEENLANRNARAAAS